MQLPEQCYFRFLHCLPYSTTFLPSFTWIFWMETEHNHGLYPITTEMPSCPVCDWVPSTICDCNPRFPHLPSLAFWSSRRIPVCPIELCLEHQVSSYCNFKLIQILPTKQFQRPIGHKVSWSQIQFYVSVLSSVWDAFLLTLAKGLPQRS